MSSTDFINRNSKTSQKKLLEENERTGALDIGLEIIRQLFKDYNPEKVFAACRIPSEAIFLQESAQNEKRLHIVKIDVVDTRSFPKVVEEVKSLTNGVGIHVLINNAGIFRGESQSFPEISEETMLEFYRVNTLGPLLLSQAFLPLLCEANNGNQEEGLIVNFASRIGSIAENQSGGLYASRCSRSAINAATKSMSIDLKNKNIMVVAMNPGWVKTDQGGEGAKIEVEHSVKSLLNVLDKVDSSQTGRLIQYDGEILEW